MKDLELDCLIFMRRANYTCTPPTNTGIVFWGWMWRQCLQSVPYKSRNQCIVQLTTHCWGCRLSSQNIHDKVTTKSAHIISNQWDLVNTHLIVWQCWLFKAPKSATSPLFSSRDDTCRNINMFGSGNLLTLFCLCQCFSFLSCDTCNTMYVSK